ncbi:hypothetical protein EDD16DRAFT_1569390 [Pisolithus croceorrhizus]|nr:hypothetical protein EV401DRAFT_1959119 [Pisolithus croceorrhizus]KAI6122887.1 hypothetical protein EDD16DRAFT_1569390 [Pisolithus croceorrhizus]KAI6168992.1 hypothetical protein EDD17DRAFT_1502959 [Pisolithus thermaeus]
MSVTPGFYRITTHLNPNPAVGIDPRVRSAFTPVIVVPSDFPFDGTRWEVIEEDDRLYILLVNTARTRPEEGKVFAFYGQPGERWRIVHHPLRRGYTILNPDESLAWYLPDSSDFTQVELRRQELILGEGYFFNLERLIED